MKFEKAHEQALKKVEQLYQAIYNLRYEGKASEARNVASIEEVIGFFRRVLLPHIEEDEKYIFPFVARHIPRLNRAVHLLSAEHEEFKKALDIFDRLLSRFLKAKEAEKRERIFKFLLEKGVYLVCLMRSHIRLETQRVYAPMMFQLKEKEWVLLLSGTQEY